jgi:hypothetical protein
LLRPWRHNAVFIQRFGDAHQAVAHRAQLKNPPHDRGFSIIDATLDVCTLAIRTRDGHVVVTKGPTAAHVARPGLPLHGIERPLAGLFSLKFVSVCGDRH